MAEQKRPYYIPKPQAPQPPKKANAVPVADWSIAKVMFWKQDSKKKS